MRLVAILMACSLALAACGDDGPVKDPDVRGSQPISAEDDPTFQCQASRAMCESPSSRDVLCCPIAAEPSNDCSMTGGTEDPGCTEVCDASTGAFEPLIQNDDGCWVWDGISNPPAPVVAQP